MDTEVDVQNPTLALVPGMYATRRITLDERHGVLTVPIQALDRAEGTARVVVVDADRPIETRPIVLGLETPDRVEVVVRLARGRSGRASATARNSSRARP